MFYMKQVSTILYQTLHTILYINYMVATDFGQNTKWLPPLPQIITKRLGKHPQNISTA